MCRPEPIRVGDKFKINGNVWRVIGTYPGGKVDLFDGDRFWFTMMYVRELRECERVK
jgi:hypothetical protein